MLPPATPLRVCGGSQHIVSQALRTAMSVAVADVTGDGVVDFVSSTLWRCCPRGLHGAKNRHACVVKWIARSMLSSTSQCSSRCPPLAAQAPLETTRSLGTRVSPPDCRIYTAGSCLRSPGAVDSPVVPLCKERNMRQARHCTHCVFQGSVIAPFQSTRHQVIWMMWFHSAGPPVRRLWCMLLHCRILIKVRGQLLSGCEL